MAFKAKPAPRRTARASEAVGLARRDARKLNPHTDRNQAGEICCYDGRDLTGWLIPRGTGWLAYAASGKFLGSFASDRLAASAVYEAAKRAGSAR